MLVFFRLYKLWTSQLRSEIMHNRFLLPSGVTWSSGLNSLGLHHGFSEQNWWPEQTRSGVTPTNSRSVVPLPHLLTKNTFWWEIDCTPRERRCSHSAENQFDCHVYGQWKDNFFILQYVLTNKSTYLYLLRLKKLSTMRFWLWHGRSRTETFFVGNNWKCNSVEYIKQCMYT